MAIAIEKNYEVYLFYGENEDGEMLKLGQARVREQENDEEETLVWYEGFFDTRPISFDDDDDLIRNIKRRKPHEDVYFL